MDNSTPIDGKRLTVVEEGTEFAGSMKSNCAVVVKGKIAGELISPALTVTPSGAVSGKVKVDRLESQGEIAGEFEADHANLSGTVSEATIVRARTLEIKLTAEGLMTVTFGNETRLEIGDEPKLDG